MANSKNIVATELPSLDQNIYIASVEQYYENPLHCELVNTCIGVALRPSMTVANKL
jgi:hypothetical protein